MKVLLAGDSWGIGVFTGKRNNYGPTGQGIQSILESQGHTVTNISKGGGSNWLMMDRLDHQWGDTGRCLFGTSDPEIKFNIGTIDYIIFIQTDIFRERHYYGKQYVTDTNTQWKILEQAFVDELLSYNSIQEFTDEYFTRLYSKLNSYNKPILCLGGWSQLHPSITKYANLTAVVTSATKLLIPELIADGYISDPEWFIQLSANQPFMSKFAQEFKALTIQNTDKLKLIYRNWNEVHPNLAGYEVLAKKITNYLL
jgi:hypothetical protein